MNCPNCGSESPFWISVVFVRVVDYPCYACGQLFRLDYRGLVILFGGAIVTALLAWAAGAAAASPFVPFLVAVLGLLLTGDATRRFGELVKKHD